LSVSRKAGEAERPNIGPGIDVEALRRGFEAYAEGGFDAIRDAFDPDVEWRTGEDEPDVATYRGHNGVKERIDAVFDSFTDLSLQPERFIVEGNNVVVPLGGRLRGRGSGVEVDFRETWVFTLRDGKITRVREYRNTADALEAVGAPQRHWTPRVELLWWRECPSWDRALSELRKAMIEVGLDPDSIEVREVASEEGAERESFVGSPTIRIDGADISPLGPDEPVGLTCRIYRLRDGRVSPTPDPADVRAALERAVSRTSL
jgi:ketosteroid isomerase-like protein